MMQFQLHTVATSFDSVVVGQLGLVVVYLYVIHCMQMIIADLFR